MTNLADKYRTTMRAVALDRQRGDAMKKAGRDEEAEKLYERGIWRLDELLAESNNGELLNSSDYAELLGVAGGLFRRRNQMVKALENYTLGAEVERAGDLASTYNRVNSIKLALLGGQCTVAELREQLLEAEVTLGDRLKKDPVAASDAWLWADLGDIRILLGSEADALEAYKLFAQKATTGSPRKALALLEEIASALTFNEDPSSKDLALSIRRAKPILT
jgi:hypothetical protein